MLKKYRHNPAHLFLDDQAYFITAACYQKQHLLAKDMIKTNLIDTLHDFANRIGWKMDHWVVLDNHYHFSAKSKNGKDLSYLMGNVHRKTAKYVRRHLAIDSSIWWNYWDYCPRDETDYFQHLNNYVADLQDYRWSSFQSLFDEVGRDLLEGQFRRYGYRDLGIDFEDDDDF